MSFLCVCLLQTQCRSIAENVEKTSFFFARGICWAGGNILYYVKTAWQQQNKFVLEPNFSRFLSAWLYATDKGIYFLFFFWSLEKEAKKKSISATNGQFL